MKIDLERLSRLLGYTFKKPAYLKQALTHRSAGSDNYERFEFLGDSILSFVIANELFSRFTLQSEGQLSRLRAHLVKGDMLAEVAKEIALGDYLYLGQGELKSGGFRRASILADTLEAIFAAIYLDSDIDTVKAIILKLYQTRLDDPELHDCIKDAKTQLQEYLQSTKMALPVYTLAQIAGDEQDPIFHVTCSVEGVKFISKGEGANRRKAEQIAARSLLEFLIPKAR